MDCKLAVRGRATWGVGGNTVKKGFDLLLRAQSTRTPGVTQRARSAKPHAPRSAVVAPSAMARVAKRRSPGRKKKSLPKEVGPADRRDRTEQLLFTPKLRTLVASPRRGSSGHRQHHPSIAGSVCVLRTHDSVRSFSPCAASWRAEAATTSRTGPSLSYPPRLGREDLLLRHRCRSGLDCRGSALRQK